MSREIADKKVGAPAFRVSALALQVFVVGGKGMKPVDSLWQGVENVAFKAFESLRSFLEIHRAARHVEALLFLKLIADIGSAFSEAQRSSISEMIPVWSAFACSQGDRTWNDIISADSDIARVLDDAILAA